MLWLQVGADGKERLPLAVALAATQGNTTSASIPTTLKEAKDTRWWPMVKDAVEAEIRGKAVDNGA